MTHLCSRSLILVGLLALASPATAAEERGTYRQFRDWIAACDNTRSCRAFALPEGADATGHALRIDRAGDPAAAPRIFFNLSDEDRMRREGRVSIRGMTGEIASLTIGRGFVAGEGQYEITDRQAVGAIIAELRRAKELRIAFDPKLTGQETEDLAVSLDGASAALLWMDDRQKRVGTVTALARPGERPASAVPLPPAAPAALASRLANGGPAPQALPRAITDAVMAAYRRIPGDDCNQEDGERGAPSIDRLGPQLLLVGIRCWRGAYNFSRAYYLVEEGERPQVRPAAFPRLAILPREPGAGPEPADNILWNADFSARTSGISHFSKGRGLGDCGERGHWQWDGRAFRPAMLRLMPVCRGVLSTYWFPLYRTREGRAQ
jgi:hypothetical protein